MKIRLIVADVGDAVSAMFYKVTAITAAGLEVPTTGFESLERADEWVSMIIETTRPGYFTKFFVREYSHRTDVGRTVQVHEFRKGEWTQRDL